MQIFIVKYKDRKTTNDPRRWFYPLNLSKQISSCLVAGLQMSSSNRDGQSYVHLLLTYVQLRLSFYKIVNANSFS